jgi:nicotinate phosphoribosyltransferase
MIIASLLDTDFYKITMGQVIFDQFPRAVVQYQFINRGRTPFPPGFAASLQRHIAELADLRFQAAEIAWLKQTAAYFKPTYLEWLANYRFNPDEVTVRQQGAVLEIEVLGPWYRTVYWEVPVLALVSELFFAGRQPSANWQDRIQIKSEKMTAAGVRWVDFGSRRRFSLAVQDKLNEVMKRYRPQYLGTSNPYLARKHDLPAVGTFAHEGPMAMQARVGLLTCNQAWLEAWVKEYQGELGIALTDTLTSAYFFRHFGPRETQLFDGIRQDSGDPALIADMAIRHYRVMNVDPSTKRIVFSDNLTDDKLIALHRQFGSQTMVVGGIGTFLTNDVGQTPLNIVMKLTGADFGQGLVPVIKLSDEPGKYTGDQARIAAAKSELGIR